MMHQVLRRVVVVSPEMLIPIISCNLMVASRGFHLAHSGFSTTMGSWAAVEPNGMGLPSRVSPPRLGALLPSPRRVLRALSRRFYRDTKSLCHSSPPLQHLLVLELLPYVILDPCTGQVLGVFLGSTWITGTPCSLSFRKLLALVLAS